ncbi:MAG: DUF2130 domain-containing protein [Candidatus Bathyarchaeia archaeon]
MIKESITCPFCGREIELTEAITHKIESEVRAKFQSEIAAKEKEFNKKEQELLAKEKEILKAKDLLDTEIEKRIKIEREKLIKEARVQASEEFSTQVSALKEELAEKDKKLHEAQKIELELRRQRAELEERSRNLELEIVRRVDEERTKVYEEARKKFIDEYSLKDREREKLIQDLKAQIEDMKRKAEQGSQQVQGEVLELELEEILKTAFPIDNIEPVPKGIKGADVIQKVNNQFGSFCGSIIWESKRTKNWSDAWIDKLKEDQREIGAEIAVLLTTVLPKDIRNFGMIRGVWVTDYASLIGLATSIRLNLIQVSSIKQSMVGQNEKMEALYHYLSGQEFKQKVEAIVEAFVNMQKDLNAEKRAMEAIWKKREKQIERVLKNTIRMYGDMQGIIGAQLPQIKALELPAITDDSHNNDDN